jgi:hypothetical protein
MTDEAIGHALARIQARAAQIREDEDFKAILVQLKNRAIRRWAETKSGEAHARETYWHDLQAACRLENYLKELADGKTLDDRKRMGKSK